MVQWSWFSGHGSGLMVNGSRFMVKGYIWFMVHGSWLINDEYGILQ